MANSRSNAPATPILAVSCRMLRSPSHESVTTDLTLLSVSSLASDAFGKHRIFTSKDPRGRSPNLDVKHGRPADIPEIIWFEEGNELIRSCAILNTALGMQKSFSTSDIIQLPFPKSHSNALRPTVSELALNSLQSCGYRLDNLQLEHTSRSCSTWVAVGELASTSQLPSPHGGPSNTSAVAITPPPPAFTTADFIRSVNKKVRQNYIRRRLLTTYRALDRLSQSEFNLDKLGAIAVAAASSNASGPTDILVQKNMSSSKPIATKIPSCKIEISSSDENTTTSVNNLDKKLLCEQLKKNLIATVPKNLTIHDIEEERGKPLSKYERNMMIFNWLHSLDETSTVEDMPNI